MSILAIMPENPTLPKLAAWDEFSKVSVVAKGTTVTLLGGQAATCNAIGEALKEEHEIILWSGHGDVGKVAVADGFISSEWLSVQLKQAPPSVIVLAACMSGARTTDHLDTIAETISQAGINVVGMWCNVLDTAAITYNVEFVRSMLAGGSLSQSHRVAVGMMVQKFPSMAGSAFLVGGIANGYGKIKGEMRSINNRLDRMEANMETIMRRLPAAA